MPDPKAPPRDGLQPIKAASNRQVVFAARSAALLYQRIEILVSYFSIV